MNARISDSVRSNVTVLVPTTSLGDGLDMDGLQAGIAARPDLIAVDGGASGCAAAVLDKGGAKHDKAAITKEWRALMQARAETGAPLVLGSAGGSGVDAMVDMMAALTREIAAERGERLNLATVKCSQEPDQVATAWLSGLVDPLEDDGPEVDDEALRQFNNIVVRAGVEHVQGALDEGADIVILGRSTAMAPVAALPIARELSAADAWHAAKLAHCGAPEAVAGPHKPILIKIDHGGFTIAPAARHNVIPPEALLALAGDAESDPFALLAPGGKLDLSDAHYEENEDARGVRVRGAAWTEAKPYRMQLEAASATGRGAAAPALAHTLAMLDPWSVCRLEKIAIGD